METNFDHFDHESWRNVRSEQVLALALHPHQYDPRSVTQYVLLLARSKARYGFVVLIGVDIPGVKAHTEPERDCDTNRPPRYPSSPSSKPVCGRSAQYTDEMVPPSRVSDN